jgi:hypothetical protein
MVVAIGATPTTHGGLLVDFTITNAPGIEGVRFTVRTSGTEVRCDGMETYHGERIRSAVVLAEVLSRRPGSSSYAAGAVLCAVCLAHITENLGRSPRTVPLAQALGVDNVRDLMGISVPIGTEIRADDRKGTLAAIRRTERVEWLVRWEDGTETWERSRAFSLLTLPSAEAGR